MTMKPKSSKSTRGGTYDNCGTPTYALPPILPYIKDKVVWESAAGNDDLIGTALRGWGGCTEVISTTYDEKTGKFDFFTYTPTFHYDIQVTNPPFSKKYKWIRHSYENNMPFALLLPVETLGSGKALRMFKKYGIEIIFLTRRINFKMPYKGWEGEAPFPVAWFTLKLGIGREISVAEIDNSLDPYLPLTEM